MSESVAIQIADAIAEELRSADPSGFAMSISEVNRLYVPRYKLEQMGVLRVSVVPANVEQGVEARSMTTQTHETHIGIQKRGDESEFDDLMLLTQQVADYFRLRPLNEFPDAQWVGAEMNPLFSVEHAEQWNQFTSVIQLRHQVTR